MHVVRAGTLREYDCSCMSRGVNKHAFRKKFRSVLYLVDDSFLCCVQVHFESLLSHGAVHKPH